MKKLLLALFLALAVPLGVSHETRADIAANPSRDTYTGNGSSTVFAYTFKILNQANIAVFVDGTLQTISTHYTVSGVGNDAGGNVTFLSPPANGTQVLLLRNQPIEQVSSYLPGSLSATQIERDFDRQTAVDQQQQEQINRAVQFNKTVTGITTSFTPVAGECFGLNNAGTAVESRACEGGGGGGGGGSGDIESVSGTTGEITVTGGAGPDPVISLPTALNLSTKVLQGGTPLQFEGSTDDANETSLVVTNPTADRTFTLPDANSVAVQPASAGSNQFMVGIGSLGAITFAQPSFSNISGSVTDAQVPDNITINLAATATALAANGANCSAGNAPLGVDASGSVESCFDVATQAELDAHNASAAAHAAGIAGNAATATAFASNPTNCTAGQAPRGIDASGVPEDCTDYMEEPAGNGIVARTGANTSANRTITGTTDVIAVSNGDGVSGNPTINVGANVASATPTDDQVLVGSGSAWVGSTLPSCSNGTTDKLLYNSSTNAFSCGTDQTDSGGTGITSLNALTASTQTFAKVDDTNVTLTIGSDTSTHTFTIGWTGELAKNRQHAETAYYDDATPTFANPIIGSLTGNADTATALAANGGNCSAGSSPLGVDASGAVEGCFDVFTQAEADTHTAALDAHGAVSTNTGNRIVRRGASGEFSAGAVTATSFVGPLTGNASTATALAANPTDCTAGQFAHTIGANGDLTCSAVNFNQLAGTAAISQGGTGQTTATAAFNALDPLTTKGDIISHDGTNSIRLAVGTNGQCLKANSATSSGLEYGDCGTGGGSSAWDDLTTPDANLALSMAAFTTTFTWGDTTGSSVNLFNLTDTASNTGTGFLLNVTTQSGSALNPGRILGEAGTGLSVAADGTVTFSGATSGISHTAMSDLTSGDPHTQYVFGVAGVEATVAAAGACTRAAEARFATDTEKFFACYGASANPIDLATQLDGWTDIHTDASGTASQTATGGEERRMVKALSLPTELEGFEGTGAFTNQPANDGVELVSSNAGDTSQTATIYGTVNGADQSIVRLETVTLTGTSPVATSRTNWGKILAVKLSATTTGNITIREASGDQTITVITAGGTRAADMDTTFIRAVPKSITFRIDPGRALADTDDKPTMWRNNIAAMTITEVWCESDQGTSDINLQRDDGSAANILSSSLTCSTSGASTSTFSGSEASLAVGHKLDFVMATAAASGAPERLTVNIQAVLD